MKEIKDVVSYIASQERWARATLKELRRAIRAAAPQAKESISYHVPYYSQNGRLAYFAAYTNHCSFHWVSEEDKKTYKKELARQKVVGSTLRIFPDQKVPVAVIQKIVRSRVKKNIAKKAR